MLWNVFGLTRLRLYPTNSPEERGSGCGFIMNAFLTELIDFVYPPVCGFCNTGLDVSDAGSICVSCRSWVAYIEPPWCTRCGRAYAHEEQFAHLCGECITRPRNYRRARSVAHYRDMVRSALHRFKYGLKQHLAQTLGSLMTERLASLDAEWRYDLIMPVPLHPRRLRGRGFNQSLSLASALSGRIRVPLDRFNLKRIRWTESQVGLSETQRAFNVKDAFCISRPEAIRHACILLIDDIYTSGSTVDECSRELMNAGAEAVDVLTLARVA